MPQTYEAKRPGLRFQLRLATSSAHRRLEDVIAIEENCRAHDRYAALLARFWGFYKPLEAALARVDWRGLDPDLQQRSKLAWLHADLTTLGYSADRIRDLPLAQALPVVEHPPEALGVLYVIEGSTLGGQTILPVVRQHLGFTQKAGAQFFASYGPDVGARWRSFIATLERVGEAPAAAERIEQAALRTFEALVDWAEAAPRRPEAQLAYSHDA